MTSYQTLSIIVPFLTGLIQVGAILWGIRAMREAGQRRDRQLDEQSAALRALLGRNA